MYQQWAMDRAHGLGITPGHPIQQQEQLQRFGVANGASDAELLQSYLSPDQYNQESQDELNRRTLTQEQFSAMERDGGMLDSYGNFQGLNPTFNGDQSMLNAVFPVFSTDYKPQPEMLMYPVGAPLSSYDSTLPSNASEQSLSAFPSASNIQAQAHVSPGADWPDNGSLSSHDGSSTQTAAPPFSSNMPTLQWQSGQSVPIDPTAQFEAFQQVAIPAAQARDSPQLWMHEQSLPWSDDSYLRRASTTSLLAHSMSAIGIQTPPQQHEANFKSPAPPANIAARRSRAPRPAALGAGAFRSQSYSGALTSQGLPAHMQHNQMNVAEQPLRRIRSSNYLSAVAPGRVMKSNPSSAQRSPMHLAFAEVVHSPHVNRHVSNGNLAPPTPMSPKGTSGIEQHIPVPQQQQQPAVNHAGLPSGVYEQGYESSSPQYALPMQPVHQRSSPPHTPMTYQQKSFPARVYGNAVMENTPPQSAPAVQTSFHHTNFSKPYSYNQQQQMLAQASMHSQMHAPTMLQSQPQTQQHFMSTFSSEQQFIQPNVIFTPNQSVSIPSAGPPPGSLIQFANGVPITNADGDIELVFPTQLQFVHQHAATPPQIMHTPPQISYAYAGSLRDSPSLPAAPHMQRTSNDFFVHEYSPPEAVRRGATPRKATFEIAPPKKYSFTHTGPGDFEKENEVVKKVKRNDSKDVGLSGGSSSPASSDGMSIAF